MAHKSLISLMMFAFLVSSSLFGASTASGRWKDLAVVAPKSSDPADSQVEINVISTSEAPTDPGPVDMNPKDPQYIELAKYAVDEYNKEAKASLVYVELNEVTIEDYDNPEGVPYCLALRATDENNHLEKYRARVLVTNDNVRELLSFEPIP